MRVGRPHGGSAEAEGQHVVLAEAIEAMRGWILRLPAHSQWRCLFVAIVRHIAGDAAAEYDGTREYEQPRQKPSSARGPVEHRDLRASVREPCDVQELVMRVETAAAILTRNLQRSPTVRELVEHLGIDEETILDARHAQPTTGADLYALVVDFIERRMSVIPWDDPYRPALRFIVYSAPVRGPRAGVALAGHDGDPDENGV